MERINKIDIAKGIGISLVVYGHTFSPFSHVTHLFQMPFFFMLSGYLYNQKDTIKDTLIKKAKSLLFPYFFFLFLTNLIFIILYEILEKPYYLYPSMIIAPYGVGVALWTFIAVYVASAFFKIIDRSSEGIYKAIIVFVFFAIGLILCHYRIKIPLYVDSACTIVIFYATGYWLKKYPKIEYLIYGGFIVTIAVYAALGYFPSVDIKYNIYSDPFCYFISTGISLLLIRIASLFEKASLTRKVFSYIGRMTLVILGFHILIFEFLYLILPRNNYISAIIVSALSIICILLLNKYLQIDVFLNKIRKIQFKPIK